MPSLRAQAFSALARTTIKPVLSLHGTVAGLPVPWPYALITATAEQVVTAPRRTKHRKAIVAGQTVHITTPAEYDPSSVIMYIHGGALLLLSPKSHRRLISNVSHNSGLEVVAPRYPMAHQASVPDIVDHLLPVYTELCDRYDNVVVAGDSAGGYLSLSLLAAARRRGLPDPAALVLISPVVDLDTRRALKDFAGSDPLFPRSVLRSMADAARKSGTPKAALGIDMEALEASPLPPVLLNYAEGELLSADALYLKSRFPSIDLLCGRGMDLHVYPALGDLAPEAKDALKRIGVFIRFHIALRNAVSA